MVTKYSKLCRYTNTTRVMKIRNVAMLLNNLLYQIDIFASEVFMMMHPKKNMLIISTFLMVLGVLYFCSKDVAYSTVTSLVHSKIANI